jgi:Flp pilus assembly CpaE family ATPase
MKNYRVLVSDFGETLPAVHALSCANDAEATLRAMNLGLSRIEVWDRARLVATIPALPQVRLGESDAGVAVAQSRAAVGGKERAVIE